MKANVERPTSWEDSARVSAPASAPPIAVAGTHSQALLPTDVRRTIACAAPITTPAAASAAPPAITGSLGWTDARGSTAWRSTLGITTIAVSRAAITVAGTHQYTSSR